MKKKILLPLILMCVSIFSYSMLNVSAASTGTCGDNLNWTLDDNGTLTISGTGNMYDFSHNDYAPWKDLRLSFKEVIIEEGVTSIGDMAFYDSDMTTIIIPNSVNSIGYCTFYMCQYLSDVIIPNGVTHIEEHTFRNCESLTSIVLPNTIEKLGDYSFMDCYKLESIDLPNSISYIGSYAFENCKSLTSIILPNKITSIGLNTFMSCYKLMTITMPKSIVSISNRAFSGCSSSLTVYYTGSEADWNNIDNISAHYELTTANKIFNYIPPFSGKVEIINVTSTDNTLKYISKISIDEGCLNIESFGTVFIPYWLYDTDSEQASVQYIGSDYNLSEYEIKGDITFGTTLTAIPESALNMNIVAKSYVTSTDGNTIWSIPKYASVNDATLKIISE